jgi:hypothetical protein
VGNKWEYPKINSYGGPVVIDGRTRTENDGGIIRNISRALLKPGVLLNKLNSKKQL